MKKEEILEMELPGVEEFVEEEEIVDVEEVTPVEEVAEEEKEEGKEEKEPNWMSFLIGVRGDNLYDVKTNVDPCMLTDYTEAHAGLTMNMMMAVLKTSGIGGVETFFKMSEILVLNSVRLLEAHLEEIEISEEQYAELRNFFALDRIEELLQQRRDELINAQPVEENPQD